jgi:hypothetical protein
MSPVEFEPTISADENILCIQNVNCFNCLYTERNMFAKTESNVFSFTKLNELVFTEDNMFECAERNGVVYTEPNAFLHMEINMFVYKELNEFVYMEGNMRSHPQCKLTSHYLINQNYRSERYETRRTRIVLF